MTQVFINYSMGISNGGTLRLIRFQYPNDDCLILVTVIMGGLFFGY